MLILSVKFFSVSGESTVVFFGYRCRTPDVFSLGSAAGRVILTGIALPCLETVWPVVGSWYVVLSAFSTITYDPSASSTSPVPFAAVIRSFLAIE